MLNVLCRYYDNFKWYYHLVDFCAMVLGACRVIWSLMMYPVIWIGWVTMYGETQKGIYLLLQLNLTVLPLLACTKINWSVMPCLTYEVRSSKPAESLFMNSFVCKHLQWFIISLVYELCATKNNLLNWQNVKFDWYQYLFVAKGEKKN